MTGVLMPTEPRWFDANNRPLSSGRVHAYQSGTATRVQLYGDEALTIRLSNPVELDASGRAAIFLDPDVTYRIEVQDRDGNTVETIDGVRG